MLSNNTVFLKDCTVLPSTDTDSAIMKTIALSAAVLAASASTASAGVHKMKLHKMQQPASYDIDSALANFQSQAQWLGQKYISGWDTPKGQSPKVRGYPYPPPKDGDFRVQVVDELKGPHDVPLNSALYARYGFYETC